MAYIHNGVQFVRLQHHQWTDTHTMGWVLKLVGGTKALTLYRDSVWIPWQIFSDSTEGISISHPSTHPPHPTPPVLAYTYPPATHPSLPPLPKPSLGVVRGGWVGEEIVTRVPLVSCHFFVCWNFKIHWAISRALVSCRCFFLMETRCNEWIND